MNQIVSHIEFLLHKHNCVIVPNLGGFVINAISPQSVGIGTFQAPQYEVVFNPDLNHNDGLLAQLYMKIYRITFDKATLQIKQEVNQLKQELKENKHVELGKLGQFEINEEDQLIYIPSDIVRPDNYGLTTAILKPILQLQPSLSETKVLKTKDTRKFGSRIGFATTAAAVVALLLLLFPMDTPSTQQRAQLIANETSVADGKSAYRPIKTQTEEVRKQENEEIHQQSIAENRENVSLNEKEGEGEGHQPILGEDKQPKKNIKYYIVVGVYNVEKVAGQMINLLNSEGFMQSGSHIRSGRTDVYANSFDNEEEAQMFLRKLHREFPNHRDAWILKR